jgi:hypothetical protein
MLHRTAPLCFLLLLGSACGGRTLSNQNGNTNQNGNGNAGECDVPEAGYQRTVFPQLYDIFEKTSVKWEVLTPLSFQS